MAKGNFRGGDGSPASPFLIEDVDDLNAIRNNLKKHYKIVQDLDFKDTAYFIEEGWEPIDNFEGSLDGGFHEIKNLYINKPNSSYVGLFGHFETGENRATIKNLTLFSPTVVGNKYTGTLVGRTDKENPVVEIKGVKVILGGVMGGEYTGGVIGAAGLTTLIDSCCFSGEVLGRDRTGGFVGNNNGKIKNCVAEGEVHIKRGGVVGGFCGQSYDIGSKIENSLSITDCEVGFCHTRGRGEVINSYWDEERAGNRDSDGVGITKEELFSPNFFILRGWDNIETEISENETIKVWKLEEGKRPKLWIEKDLEIKELFLLETPEGIWSPSKNSYQKVDIEKDKVFDEKIFKKYGTPFLNAIKGQVDKVGLFNYEKDLGEKKLYSLEIGGFSKIKLR